MPKKKQPKVKQVIENLLSLAVILVVSTFIWKYVQEVDLFTNIHIDINGNEFVYVSS